MKNFPIIDKETGREYWISRSVAVLAKIVSKDNCILAVQRGNGTPDPEYVGKWCMPCGYLDFDETTKEAISREVIEETGVNIHPENFTLVNIQDNPYADKRQNVTLRFIVRLEDYSYNIPFTDKYSETEEVMGIKWIPFTDIDKYKWAFNHAKLIKEI